MIVYWKQTIHPRVKTHEDEWGNAFYKYEEVFGEVIGAMDGGNGNDEQRLIVASPEGKIDTIRMTRCYHKSTILPSGDVSLQESNGRVYGSQGIITNKDNIYTVEEWKESINYGDITDDDGTGYWVKDGYISTDEVFSTFQRDATHVIWYNK